MKNSDRIIKFRAWDKNNKKFLEEVHTYIRLDGNIEDSENNSLEDIEIMQYTGLKDKNGKDIYESDIIQFQNEEADRTPYEVPLMNYENLFYIINIGNSEFEKGKNQYSNIEVIGNIYEDKI